jgi:type IV pilus assembly protein PilB
VSFGGLARDRLLFCSDDKAWYCKGLPTPIGVRSRIEDSIMKFVDLSNMSIPPTIIEMVSESVARENVLIPIAEENGVLQIATSNPFDLDTMQKVQFILARTIQPVLASAEQIVAAISRHYGQP